MKRIFALVLATVMLLALCACGPTASTPPTQAPAAEPTAEPAADPAAEPTEAPAEAPTEEPAAELEPYYFGYSNIMVGVTTQDFMQKVGAYTIENILNSSGLYLNDEGNADKMISNVENAIGSGVNGYIAFAPADAIMLQEMLICADAGIPLVFNNCQPADEAVVSQLEANEYYVGSIAANSYMNGYEAAERAIADGCRKAVLAICTVGDPIHEACYNGFCDAFTAGGGEVLGECRPSGHDTNESMTMNEDLLVAHPDADCYYSSHSDIAIAGIRSIENLGRTGELNVYITDIVTDIVTYVKEGKCTMANGGNQAMTQVVCCLMYNFANGHPTKTADGKAPKLTLPSIQIDSEISADLYNRIIFEDYPFAEEDLLSLLYVNNPDVTVEDFQRVLDSYNWENICKRAFEAGKITADELAAMGF